MDERTKNIVAHLRALAAGKKKPLVISLCGYVADKIEKRGHI